MDGDYDDIIAKLRAIADSFAADGNAFMESFTRHVASKFDIAKATGLPLSEAKSRYVVDYLFDEEGDEP